MAFGRKKKEIKTIVVPESGDLHNNIEKEENINNEKIIESKESKKEGKKIIKKGAKIIANGRCFGSQNLECPLKTVRNYETKIIEVSEKSVLIDEGWISKENIK